MKSIWRKEKEFELQEKIAELFGYQRLQPPAMPAWQRPTKNGTEGLAELPEWPTSMLYAWTLVKIMEENGYVVELHTPSLQGNQYWVRVAEMKAKHGIVAYASGPTMPMAISAVFIDWRNAHKHYYPNIF